MDGALAERDTRVSQPSAAPAFARARFSIRRLVMDAGLAGLLRALLSILRFWRGGTAVFDPYRPELHYMRGPGPKWRAKYALPSDRIQAGAEESWP
jgi:hypothetical protein